MDVIKSSALELGLSIERAKEADFLENYSTERGNKIVKNLTGEHEGFEASLILFHLIGDYQ